MEIKILHIDDEADVLDKASKILNGSKIDDYTLSVKDSCGFEEGMEKLNNTEYDLIILDLCIGTASSASDKVGETVFNQIKDRAFMPVIFFTGLPEYVSHLKSDLVRAVGKAEGYDDLFEQIKSVLDSGFIQIKNNIQDIVRESLRSYFWNFVHVNSAAIAKLKEDDVSLKYVMLRRLARTLSTEITRSSVDNPGFQKEHSHPTEFYIYPPLDGEYETGDILQSKETGDFFVLLTPSCDLVDRGKGNRSVEKVLLIHTKDFRTLPDFEKLAQKQNEKLEIEKSGKQVSKDLNGQITNLTANIKAWMKPKKNERYFFLPKATFCPALLIDFEHKTTVTYEELEKNYDIIATLDDPINTAVLSGYARYYSRVGYRDLDTDYAFEQLMS